MKALKRLPRYHMPPALAFLAAVLLAGFITLLALWCQPNALRAIAANLLAQPKLIVLNALPVGGLVLLFGFLFRNVFYGAALTNLIVCVMSIINRVKLEVRDEPFFPRDILLIKEATAAAGEYALPYPRVVIAAVLLVTLLLAAAGLCLKCRPFSAKKRLDVGIRILGAAASLAVMGGLITTVYASNDLYNSFKVSNAYYIPSVFNELGFPYCFCHQFTTYPVDRPEGFNKTTAAAWDNETPAEGSGRSVNVIMVMNEAFSDITDHESFAFTAENDPLPNLHALQSDPHALTGHLVVPNFAAGTANTEFDVMTGMQTNALSATTTSAFRVVNRDLNSIFRVFGDAGYRTSYFHCGDRWFYNRENVLRWMGADETLFIEKMWPWEAKGRWVTDDYMAGLIETEFEEAMAAGETLFHYTTTIQNHMSYTRDKYGSDYVYPEVPLNAEVSDGVRSLLEVYIEGARDADAMLGRLVEYFSGRDEPVMLVFFGDHLPYLGDSQLGYEELGLAAQETWDALGSYETPYVLWVNEAAAETLDWSAAAEQTAIPETLSASFLGAAVTELTGYAETSPWFSFLNELRREYPVVQKNTAVLPDGSIVDPYLLDDKTPKSIEKWRQWSYYNLRYKTIK